MTRQFKYVAVITGMVPAKNRSNAYLQAAMGISLNVRLQQTQHDVAIEVVEILESDATDPELETLDEPVPPFGVPVAPNETEEDGSD
jgi:hypothetical protein